MSIEHQVWGERDNLRGKKRNRAVYLAVVLVPLLMACICAPFVISLKKAMRQHEKAMDLSQAIIRDDQHEVESLLREGIDPNDADDHDSILLAMSLDNEAMAKFLVLHGANPSKSILRVYKVEQAQMLLKLGANPNAPVGEGGYTPVMAFSRSGETGILNLLLQHGGNPRDVFKTPSGSRK